MTDRNKYWSIFEQTGSIHDYLNYTACTSEKELDTEKETNHDGINESDRDRFSNDANR